MGNLVSIADEFEQLSDFGDMTDAHEDVTFRNDSPAAWDERDAEGESNDTLLDFHDDMLDTFDELGTEIGGVDGGGVSTAAISAKVKALLDEKRAALARRRERLEQSLATRSAIKLRDKLTFSLGVSNVALSAYIAGAHPERLADWYTLKCVVLVGLRWYIYKKARWHYFLFDFCYLVNLLMLLYIWVFPNSLALFNLCCAFALGPLAWAIPLWRNSLVLHSLDKVTSVFIHLGPVMACYSIRWYPTARHALCAEPGRCAITFAEAAWWPLLPYCAWQLAYYLRVEWWGARKIKERNYDYSFKCLNRNKSTLTYRLFNMFGPQYAKLTFMGLQFLYTCLTLAPVALLYRSQLAHLAFYLIMFQVCTWNGAGYYFTVFAKRYLASLPDRSDDALTSAATRSRRNTAASGRAPGATGSPPPPVSLAAAASVVMKEQAAAAAAATTTTTSAANAASTESS